jgi:subtilisin family serine protease
MAVFAGPITHRSGPREREPRSADRPLSGGEALAMVGLEALRARTPGRPEVVVGLLDGPVATGLPAFSGAIVRHAPGAGPTPDDGGPARRHGTFVAGLLAARSVPAPDGICPGCTLLVRPIFADAHRRDGEVVPATTPQELAAGLVECVDAGAHVVNISAALVGPGDPRGRLREALDHAMGRGAIVVAAAGNGRSIGSSAITGHPWVIPVVAYSRRARPLGVSNLGASIGKRGLGAPGDQVAGITPVGPAAWSGTSVAAPFVSGAVALLRSVFPSVPAAGVHAAVTRFAAPRRSIVPPLLDAAAAERAMQLLVNDLEEHT